MGLGGRLGCPAAVRLQGGGEATSATASPHPQPAGAPDPPPLVRAVANAWEEEDGNVVKVRRERGRAANGGP